MLTHFTSVCITQYIFNIKAKSHILLDIILESPSEIRLSCLSTSTHMLKRRAKCKKTTLAEQSILPTAPGQAVQLFQFLQKTKVNFILSDANGNTAQKLSMNSQFHRNLKVTKAIFPFRIIKTTDVSFFFLHIIHRISRHP